MDDDLGQPRARSRFDDDINLLGWNSWRLASLLGLPTDRAPRRWIAGDVDPPGPIVAWVEKIADFVRANPAPPPPGGAA